jgi:hypothetical protein
MRRVLGAFAAALLAAPHVAPAASCATQNVPAATLLVPYFLVSRNGSQGEDIPEGGADTLLSVTNTGATGLVVQTTVWNKYGKPVLSFNVPMTAFDVVFFRMKDVLTGKLNVNPNAQHLSQDRDPCGLNTATGAYEPRTGFGATRYIFSLLFPNGSGILDGDNPACGLGGASDGVLSGDFSGFVTFDVVNHCTAILSQDPRWYKNDVLATAGWAASGYTPNVLMGDVFFLDPRTGAYGGAGHVSGDGMVSLPFEPSLTWGESRTFHSRFSLMEAEVGEQAPEPFRFRGDGRTPLGTRYGFRFMDDARSCIESWMIVFRWDVTPSLAGYDTDLCGWLRGCVEGHPCSGHGFFAQAFKAPATTYDNDENRLIPGGSAPPGWDPYWVFLDSQRISLRSPDINPGAFRGGCVDIELPGGALTGQAWVSVQHSGPGLALSVGHAATVLKSSLACAPVPR